MKTEYDIAEEIFNSGDYIKAFQFFKNITENLLSSDEDKSDAFLMMGVIVLIDSRVENDDESGLNYFKESLNFNPYNIGTLFNIIEGFGLSINCHKNIEMLDYAIKNLEEIKYNFTENEKNMINHKIILKENILNESPS